MKLSNGNIVLSLLALLVSSVAAEEKIYMVVRTLIRVEEALSKPEKQAIDAAFHNMGPELDEVVKEVVADGSIPPKRNLRVGDERKLACSRACQYYPSWWTMCYVNGEWIDRCRRALTMHEDLSEEEVADLNEDDRRRHLTISALCQEAKSGVADAIDGVIPIPPNSTTAEQCFYEVVTL